jgi:hypothetical protein
MSRFLYAPGPCLTALLLISTGTVKAGTLYVHCGGSGGLNSIGAALKALQHSENTGPNTINVSGACHENVLIQDTQQLTLNGVNGASISDTSNGKADVIDVDNSLVTISGFTITGGYDGVACYYGASCRLLGNTIQGASDSGIDIYPISRARIDGGALQHNGGGLLITGGDVTAGNVTVQDNSGIGVSVSRGGRLNFSQSASKNNQGYGIWVQGAHLTCRVCTVTGDQDVGVYLDLGSEAIFAGYAGPIEISSIGAGVGIFVGDVTTANFQGSVSVTGNGGSLAIQCNSATSVTRNAITAAGGAGNTNCPN